MREEIMKETDEKMLYARIYRLQKMCNEIMKETDEKMLYARIYRLQKMCDDGDAVTISKVSPPATKGGDYTAILSYDPAPILAAAKQKEKIRIDQLDNDDV